MMNLKFIIGAAILASISIVSSSSSRLKSSPQACLIADSTKAQSEMREVLTAQKLVVVAVKPSSRHKDSVIYEAKLKDAFTVISYGEHRSSVLLSWTACPDGKCPEAKMYTPHTKEYDQLDSLVLREKRKQQLRRK